MDDTWRWHDEIMHPTPWFEAPALRGLSDAVNSRPAVVVVIGWTMYAVFAGPILVNIFVGPPS